MSHYLSIFLHKGHLDVVTNCKKIYYAAKYQHNLDGICVNRVGFAIYH